jgi:hypothetical protein
VAPGDEEEFRCATCAKSKAKKSKSTSRKGKEKASVEDDDSDAASEAGDSSYAGSVEEVDEDTGSEYSEDSDDDSGSDDETLVISSAGNNPRGQVFAAKVDGYLRKEAAFRDFISETQPDDETRHRLALLQMPQGKTYTEEDLGDEFTMQVGLHLLYNKTNGKTELHLGKSIHIKYWTFPGILSRVWRRMWYPAWHRQRLRRSMLDREQRDGDGKYFWVVGSAAS